MSETKRVQVNRSKHKEEFQVCSATEGGVLSYELTLASSVIAEQPQTLWEHHTHTDAQ